MNECGTDRNEVFGKGFIRPSTYNGRRAFVYDGSEVTGTCPHCSFLMCLLVCVVVFVPCFRSAGWLAFWLGGCRQVPAKPDARAHDDAGAVGRDAGVAPPTGQPRASAAAGVRLDRCCGGGYWWKWWCCCKGRVDGHGGDDCVGRRGEPTPRESLLEATATGEPPPHVPADVP
jgi:hypothetical protein